MNKKRLGTIAVILGFSLVIGACVFSIAGKVVTEKAEDDEFKKISHSVSADSTVTTKETQTKTETTATNNTTTKKAQSADEEQIKFSPRIEALIKSAFRDGVLTKKEKEIIIKRAVAEGEDADEFELLLSSRIADDGIKEEE